MSTRNTTSASVTKQGVFMNIHGCGVLITGSSGIGKSEVALSLIQQGHFFIADDIICFEKKENNIVGHSPDILADFMEIRGLGILNIRRMYGDHVIQPNATLELIVALKKLPAKELKNIDRIRGLRGTFSLLGKKIPTLTIPVGVSRHLASLIEAAVLNAQLEKAGYTASKIFIHQHKKRMLRNNHDNSDPSRHTP